MTNRKEWLEWRRQGIGSSDCPIIMGTSPWSTPLKLWEEKTSTEEVKEDMTNQFIKNKGNIFEPKIRALFETQMDMTFAPACVQMEQHSFMRASLDGRSECKRVIIEIKISGKEDWDGAKAGKVPEKYIAQIQHQLLVSDASFCYFLSYQDLDKGLMILDNLAVVQVFPDPVYQQNLLKKCTEFWYQVTEKITPGLSDKDYKKLPGMTKVANAWKRAKLKAEKVACEMDILKTELLKAAEEAKHPRLQVAGIKLMKVQKVGNIAYKSIPELASVDLEKYRGSSSVYWKIDG